MGFFILTGIVFLIIFIYQFYDGNYIFPEEIPLAAFMWIIVTFVIGIMGTVFVSMIFGSFAESKYEIEEQHKLVSMNDHFYVRTFAKKGYITYAAIYTDEENEYKIFESGVEHSVVHITEGVPTLTTSHKYFKNKFLRWLFPYVAFTYRYDYYVPEGTIKTDFNIDLE